MAQDYTADCFAGTHGGQADLQLMENNFEALRTSFSGASAPSVTTAGQFWFDTSSEGLKIRDDGDATWMGAFLGEASTKIWIYSNTAGDGWVIDSSVTDCVLALKTTTGTNDYNATGGTIVGTWTQPSHALITAETAAHTHDSGGSHSHQGLAYVGGAYHFGGLITSTTYTNLTSDSSGLHTHGSLGDGDSHSHGSSYRNYASVGTMQYLAGVI